MNSYEDRVVVTGLGAISPFGIGSDLLFSSVLDLKSCISKLPDHLATSNIKIGGYIDPLTFENSLDKFFISSKDYKRYDKFITLGLIATQDAINDAGILNNDIFTNSKSAILVSTGIGGISTLSEASVDVSNAKKISPFTIPYILTNILSGLISIKYNIQGLNFSISSACATSAHSIGEAYEMIKSGRYDIIIAGGSEAALTKIGITGFDSMKALSTRYNDTPEKASRPLDKNRDGFVMSEGAGIIILESYKHAKKRNAKIYCELSGYGASSDAFHMTAPHENGNGIKIAVKEALKKAKIEKNDIDYINLHATSTPLGDIPEVNALKNIFQEDIKKIAISSTKSSTGHMLGSISVIEAILSIKSIEKNILLPQINLENPCDEVLDLNIVTSPESRKIDKIISNSFGFGGTNAVLVFSRI